MSKERTKDTFSTPSEERELKLDEFLSGKITATKLLTDLNDEYSDLKDAVLALAHRNMKQGKA